MKKTLYVVVSTIIVILTFSAHKYLLPFVDDDEYYESVDNIEGYKFITIHYTQCPLECSKWFTEKHSKYDIMIKANAELCEECITGLERRKLYTVYGFNKREFAFRLPDSIRVEYMKNYK